jgi:hypothetical protein
MAARKPLVIADGQIQQLQSGDTLDAAVSEVDLVSATNKEAGAIVIGTPVYVSGAGQVKKAKADAAGTAPVLGLVKTASIAGDAAGSIQTSGVMPATTGQWDSVCGTTGGLTPGAAYYLSEDTAGLMTETAPTGVGELVVKVGLALSTTEMMIDPERPILL